MYIDKFLQVSDGQAVTVSAASADVIDFGQVTPNVGLNAKPLHMVFAVAEAAAASGNATVTFSIQDSADGAAFADVVASGAVVKTDLVAGAMVALPMPVTHRRYVRAYYTVGTGPLTAGKFSAQVVAGLQLNKAYPDAVE